MQKIGKHSDPYKGRKRWFWAVFILLFVISAVLLSVFSSRPRELTHVVMTVGICGEINHGGIYRIPEGSDLAQLIRKGGGLTYNADIRKIDLGRIAKNDSIYSIPRRIYSAGTNTGSNLSKAIAQLPEFTPDTFAYHEKEIRHLSILYIEFPSVFMLVNYYPDQKRLSMVNIPHSTILLNNDYRLVDIFFTLGIGPTVKILENNLGQHIDYYLIQDRLSFISLVDMVSGIDLPIDQPFAEAYHLKAGTRRVDGFYTWEYLRFMDTKRMNGKLIPSKELSSALDDKYKIPPKDLQLAYELRQYRQRNVISALRHAFMQALPAEQVTIIQNIMKSFETNIGKELVFSLYKDLLSVPGFSLGTLPGYYSDLLDKLYYYPDIPGFKMLRNQEIRKYLNQDDQTKPQAIY